LNHINNSNVEQNNFNQTAELNNRILNNS